MTIKKPMDFSIGFFVLNFIVRGVVHIKSVASIIKTASYILKYMRLLSLRIYIESYL